MVCVMVTALGYSSADAFPSAMESQSIMVSAEEMESEMIPTFTTVFAMASVSVYNI